MAALPVTPMPTPPPGEPPLSEGARIINTFIAPSKTFTDLRRNANWWAPWLLISVFGLLFVFVMGKQIGFEQISKNSIAQSSRADQFENFLPISKPNSYSCQPPSRATSPIASLCSI